MSLHALLSRVLPPAAATVATAAAYAGLLVTILLLLSVAPAEFRYGGY